MTSETGEPLEHNYRWQNLQGRQFPKIRIYFPHFLNIGINHLK